MSCEYYQLIINVDCEINVVMPKQYRCYDKAQEALLECLSRGLDAMLVTYKKGVLQDVRK